MPLQDTSAPGRSDNARLHANPRRKTRSDKGILRGPAQPRQACYPTRHVDHVSIPLTGAHGHGHRLELDTDDAEITLAMSEEGRKLYVVQNGDKTAETVKIGGSCAQAFAGSTNPQHNITVARLLLGETHKGRRVRFRDRNPFNMRRDNLYLEVNATGTHHDIDWSKAEQRRAGLVEHALATAHG